MYRPSELIARQRRYLASMPDWPRDDRAIFWLVALGAIRELKDVRPDWWMSDVQSFEVFLIVTWWFPMFAMLGVALGLATMWAYRFAKRAAIWLIASSIPERRT